MTPAGAGPPGAGDTVPPARRRRICVFTATRAEYGLLHHLLTELEDAVEVDLQLLVSGSHLVPRHGATWRAIVADGFAISATVEMSMAGDTAVAVTKSMGVGLIGMADALDRLRPDVVVVVGDRFEVLVAAQAAVVAGIPVAHVAGGESTEGALDESFRHAVTKLAHLHFVATEAFRRRLVDHLGEDPRRVFTVGSPGLDNVRDAELLSRDQLAASLGMELRPPVVAVAYHSTTLELDRGARAVRALLGALDTIPGATVVFTMPNADAGNETIAAAVHARVAAAGPTERAFASLGRVRYLSLLAHADVIVGNSSSGLIEAPSLGTPTVNVGNRQRGRLRGETVIDSEESPAAIAAAIRTALGPQARARAAVARSPYGDGRTAPRIARVLVCARLEGILVKRMPPLQCPTGTTTCGADTGGVER